MLVEVAVAIAGYVFRDQVSREWGGGDPSQVALGIWGRKSVLYSTHFSALR